jgi:hypothetical protein
LKSGILCPKCSEKVKSGEITDSDLKIARVLLSLEESYPSRPEDPDGNKPCPHITNLYERLCDEFAPIELRGLSEDEK